MVSVWCLDLGFGLAVSVPPSAWSSAPPGCRRPRRPTPGSRSRTRSRPRQRPRRSTGFAGSWSSRGESMATARAHPCTLSRNARQGSAFACALGGRRRGARCVLALAGHPELLAYAAPLLVVALPLVAGATSVRRRSSVCAHGRAGGRAPAARCAARRRGLGVVPARRSADRAALAERGPPAASS